MENKKKEVKKVLACQLCGGNCWFCSYADSCGNWNDTDPDDIPVVKVENNIKKPSGRL